MINIKSVKKQHKEKTKQKQNKIQFIITKWLLFTYSVNPVLAIGTGPNIFGLKLPKFIWLVVHDLNINLWVNCMC